jgi:hypothetical protein
VVRDSKLNAKEERPIEKKRKRGEPIRKNLEGDDLI